MQGQGGRKWTNAVFFLVPSILASNAAMPVRSKSTHHFLLLILYRYYVFFSPFTPHAASSPQAIHSVQNQKKRQCRNSASDMAVVFSGFLCSYGDGRSRSIALNNRFQL